jgi:hypothetical protein
LTLCCLDYLSFFVPEVWCVYICAK